MGGFCQQGEALKLRDKLLVAAEMPREERALHREAKGWEGSGQELEAFCFIRKSEGEGGTEKQMGALAMLIFPLQLAGPGGHGLFAQGGSWDVSAPRERTPHPAKPLLSLRQHPLPVRAPSKAAAGRLGTSLQITRARRAAARWHQEPAAPLSKRWC